MRKLWIAMAVCAGVALGNVEPVQAAMSMGDTKVSTSIVEQAKKRGRGRAACQYKLIFWCCTPPGGQEQCTIK
jgi:hypothetical protein